MEVNNNIEIVSYLSPFSVSSYSMSNELTEVIEMKKIKKSEIKIGPDIHIGHTDKIQTHSSFICFKCKKNVRNGIYIFQSKKLL